MCEMKKAIDKRIYKQ